MRLYNVRAGTRATKINKKILSVSPPTHTRESCRPDPAPSCSQYNNNNMYIMWCVVLGDGATRRNQSRPITAKLYRSGHPRGLTGISSPMKYLGGSDFGVPPEFYAYIARLLRVTYYWKHCETQCWQIQGAFTHPTTVVFPCYTMFSQFLYFLYCLPFLCLPEIKPWWNSSCRRRIFNNRMWQIHQSPNDIEKKKLHVGQLLQQLLQHWLPRNNALVCIH